MDERYHEETIRKTKTYVCEICKYKTNYKSNVKRHMKKHVNARNVAELETPAQDRPTHVCDTCGKTLRSQCGLKRQRGARAV